MGGRSGSLGSTSSPTLLSPARMMFAGIILGCRAAVDFLSLSTFFAAILYLDLEHARAFQLSLRLVAAGALRSWWPGYCILDIDQISNTMK